MMSLTGYHVYITHTLILVVLKLKFMPVAELILYPTFAWLVITHYYYGSTYIIDSIIKIKEEVSKEDFLLGLQAVYSEFL